MENKLTYREAGVDIDAGNLSVSLIKDSVKATYRPEVLGDLGGFGLFKSGLRLFTVGEADQDSALIHRVTFFNIDFLHFTPHRE